MILCPCRNITEEEAEQMTAEDFMADAQCGSCLEWFLEINQ